MGGEIVQIDKELIRGSTTMLVLGLLQRKAMYGYEMIKEAESLSEGVFQFKEGTLYPVLHALEAESYIESYWCDTDSARKRKYYRLTRKGLELLGEKQKEWSLFTRAVGSVLGGAL